MINNMITEVSKLGSRDKVMQLFHIPDFLLVDIVII